MQETLSRTTQVNEQVGIPLKLKRVVIDTMLQTVRTIFESPCHDWLRVRSGPSGVEGLDGEGVLRERKKTLYRCTRHNRGPDMVPHQVLAMPRAVGFYCADLLINVDDFMFMRFIEFWVILLLLFSSGEETI